MWFSRQTSITADFVEVHVLQKLFGPTSSKREKKVPKSDRTTCSLAGFEFTIISDKISHYDVTTFLSKQAMRVITIT